MPAQRQSLQKAVLSLSYLHDMAIKFQTHGELSTGPFCALGRMPEFLKSASIPLLFNLHRH